MTKFSRWADHSETAGYYDFSHDFLGHAARRIINEVRGCVVYDITSKPPGTIEWE